MDIDGSKNQFIENSKNVPGLCGGEDVNGLEEESKDISNRRFDKAKIVTTKPIITIICLITQVEHIIHRHIIIDTSK